MRLFTRLVLIAPWSLLPAFLYWSHQMRPFVSICPPFCPPYFLVSLSYKFLIILFNPYSLSLFSVVLNLSPPFSPTFSFRFINFNRFTLIFLLSGTQYLYIPIQYNTRYSGLVCHGYYCFKAHLSLYKSDKLKCLWVFCVITFLHQYQMTHHFK